MVEAIELIKQIIQRRLSDKLCASIRKGSSSGAIG